jgi:2-polyprenyl-3-methyl-5-hydroxy-6-metoxy-1,4-benzoquinol methylase
MDEDNLKVIQLPSLDIRIPKWDLDDLNNRTCPVCNNSTSSIKYTRPDRLTIVLCNNCNTYFVSPAPTQDQLTRFYIRYDKVHRRQQKIGIKELINNYKSVNPYADYRIQELSKHISLKDSLVLDIGFGRAKFMYSLKKLGAIPYGVELDETAIKYATALGIKNVYKGNLEDVDFGVKFDVIVLNDLIEHPLNPMNLLNNVVDLLNEKGLLMIWTPNGEATTNEINPITFRVDLEHMQYLTPRSCKFIAMELSLKTIHLETCGYPSLDGIDKPLKKTLINKTQIIQRTLLIPGVRSLYNNYKKLKKNTNQILARDISEGAYHLFCIMQK